MDIAIKLSAAVVLVLLNALFVAAEFAFVRVRETSLEILAQKGSARARMALFGQKHLEDYLSVCQLGITLSSLGLGWLGEPAVASLLRPAFEWFGLANPALVHSLSIMVGFGLITFIHVTFGELAPKNVSIRAAEKTSLLLAFPMRFFHVAFKPFVSVLNFSAQLTLNILGASRWVETPAHSTEELKLLIAESRGEGELDAVEERLLNNIFNMDKRFARDIMVHRTRVKMIGANATPEEAIQVALRHGHTRLPVYDGDKDNIVGFIHAKDLLRIKGQPVMTIRPLIRPALYVYENTPADEILESIRVKKTKLGLVWDEFGTMLGLITMEDVLEAIVGDIRDEFDAEELSIESLPDGDFLADTTVSLDELSQHVSLDLLPGDEEQYRTLASLLEGKFGDGPKAGDTWLGYGASFTVVDATGTAIDKVRVKSLPSAKKEGEGEEEVG
jgi:CBS domain containing-hemolysin-like protein